MELEDTRSHPSESIGLHAFDQIYKLISIFQALTIFYFVFLGVLFPFFQGRYFRFGAPITVIDTVVNDNGRVALVLGVIILERLVAHTFETNVELASQLKKEHPKTYAVVTMVNRIDNFANYMRIAFTFIYIRSQISFAMVYLVADVIIFIVKVHRMNIERNKDRQDRHPILIRPTHKGILAMAMVQLVAIYLMFSSFILIGMKNSEYFSLQPPLIIFEKMIVSKTYFWTVVTVIFLDHIYYTIMNIRVGKFFKTTFTNPEVIMEDLRMSSWKIWVILVFHRLLYWIRLVFVVNFLLSKYLFVWVYTLADIIARTANEAYDTHYNAKYATPKSKKGQDDNRLLYLMAGFVAETTLLVGFMFGLGWWQVGRFFTWGAPITLFSTYIYVPRLMKALQAYTGIERAIATLYNDITATDAYNWLYNTTHHMHPSSIGKNIHEFDAIMLVGRLHEGVRLIMISQVVVGNISFSIISGAVDVPLACLVMYAHMQYKTRKDKEFNSTKRIFDLSSTDVIEDLSRRQLEKER